MSLNRYAAKRDENEKEIVAALRKHGVKVYLLDTPCDLLCWCGKVQFHIEDWVLLEVKMLNGKLTPKQAKFIEDTDCHVVTNSDEALKAVGVL